MAIFRSLSAIADLFKDLVQGGKAWHSSNDGAGSGLDADLLDGHHSTYFLPATGKAVDSDKLDGNDSAYYLATTNDQMSNMTGNWHTFVNDGGGNIGQRWNSTPGDSNKLVEDGIAYELEISDDSVNGDFKLNQGTSPNGTAGEDITWNTSFFISGEYNSFNIPNSLNVGQAIDCDYLICNSIRAVNLLTNDPGIDGMLWNNNGVVNVSAGN